MFPSESLPHVLEKRLTALVGGVLGSGVVQRARGRQRQLVPTTGSMLVLSPAYDLSLPDMLSSGSLGAFNIQFNLQVFNQYAVPIQAEICLICVNLGLMITTSGTSSIYTGILTKQACLDAKSSEAGSSSEHERQNQGRSRP
jgi:hypothetical protein